MNELKRNGEGYMDPTAYKAIVEADKPVPGDIFSADGEEWLVLAYNEGVMVVLKLFAERKSEWEVEVISRAVKYTDPRFIQYRFYYPASYNLVKALSEKEYKSVIEAVQKVLGIQPALRVPEEKTVFKCDTRIVERVAGNADFTMLQSECYALKREAELYKSLYEDMLERLIAR
jgi:hypothetical protein